MQGKIQVCLCVTLLMSMHYTGQVFRWDRNVVCPAPHLSQDPKRTGLLEFFVRVTRISTFTPSKVERTITLVEHVTKINKNKNKKEGVKSHVL